LVPAEFAYANAVGAGLFAAAIVISYLWVSQQAKE
jgi:hypothetical protein